MNWLSLINPDADVYNFDANFESEIFKTDASHFIITEKDQYKGCLSREALDLAQKDISPKDFTDEFEIFFGQSHQNILDIFSLFVNHQTNRLPILGDHHTFMGVLHLNDIFEIISETNFISNKADTIIIRKSSIDFAYSELFHLLESMNAKILGSFISDHNSDFVEVFIKIKHQGLNEILQSLRRFKYNIVSQHDEDQHEIKLKEHSAYLDKYLNI
ncbi:MAG: hypothetical protein ACTH3E_10315 [Psychroflexus halocasei]